ncbi:MAG: 6-phospho-3-hexuloisomerase [Thermoprotei archaeon]|nr:MAG: 6-phospho-3-hexuloisomerase [Thermoprotei archaeon]RLE68905.1 MAG: 6-phospho-3-hexuloisomerase [Thermoprotei archaeon]
MKFKTVMKYIGNYVRENCERIDENDVRKLLEIMMNTIDQYKKIMIIGAGRSGLIGKAFAMRLMHLGFNVYVIGETITPRINKGDIIIAISGSGSTELVITAAATAKKIGAKIIAITSYPDSPLGKIADHIIYVPGRTKVSLEKNFISRQILGLHEPLAPLGTLFEIMTMVFLDSVIVELMNRLGVTEEDMYRRHANIE